MARASYQARTSMSSVLAFRFVPKKIVSSRTLAASATSSRYIPVPSLKRQIRCLKKGALPIGFASSRPHPNGRLLA